MIRNLKFPWLNRLPFLGLVCALALSCPAPAAAQTTISTGSIQGTISDPSGAAVPGATVTISNKATSQTTKLTTSTTGTYTSGALLPATYLVRVVASGFKTAEATIPVAVGVTSAGNFRLEVGAASTVVEVVGSAIAVDTEQPTVQGVLNRDQIENLPVSGRNFLDLAQLEPGVQIQDGGNFDPTKNGYSSISFGGRFGRTARIEVDGIDISDETVGTTTANVPASAIDQFQLSQSSLDLSTELTSSGAVNVSTRAGTNTLHGGGYWYGRNDALAARQAESSPTTTGLVPFLRHQYGVDLGGPLWKDKLFFFGTGERTRQDQQTAVVPASGAPGQPAIPAGSFTALFRDLELLGRLDYQVKPNWNIFSRYNFEQNRNVAPFVPNVFNPFLNVDYARSYVVGTNFNTGSFGHSIRFGWSKFHNAIVDAVAASGAPNPVPGVALALGGDPNCLGNAFDFYCSGANFLAPQGTFQQNTQIKYDGNKPFRNHIIRYGFGYDRIRGGGFAAFVALQPIVNSTGCNATCLALPGGAANPLNYTVDKLTLGNGQGFFTEKPDFGLPGGGQLDNRIQWYLGDTWKIRPNFTLTYGVRYVRDTGRSDSDLAAIPCSATTLITCTGNLLDQWQPGLGGRVNQPNSNYGGNLGFAWDPWKNGNTAIRGGIGIFYENAIFNNTLFDRPGRLTTGLFFGTALPCPSGSFLLPNGATVSTVNGHPIASDCGAPIGQTTPFNVANDVIALQNQFQAATLAAGPQSNGSFIGNTLAEGTNSTGNVPLSPDYVSPYSVQMNIGIERELFPGTVFKADYVRNVALHYILVLDVNHTGDMRYFNLAAAQTAVAQANNSFGCGMAFTAAATNCAIAAGATIADYSAQGLDSGNAFNGGFSCVGATAPVMPGTTTPINANGCAFPGRNPNVGQLQMAFPIGRSVYNGLQLSLQSQKKNPLPGIRNSNFIVSYSLSRYIGQARDSDFITNVSDFANPNSFIGPTGLDRRNQFSAGGVFDFPWWTRISFITHYYTALPVTLFIPAGSIFTSDLTGDGSFGGNTTGSQGDILPLTNIGSFNRGVSLGSLNNMITSYNSTIANSVTPAGQVLIQNGLFTAAQLRSLGGVAQTIQPVVPGAVQTSGLFTFDTRVGWTVHPSRFWKSFPERVVVEPQIAFFNLFNHQNFDTPSLPANGILTGCPSTSFSAATGWSTCPALSGGGAVNSTIRTDRTNLAGLGSGVFSLGAPRTIEWGVKVSF
jgi:Carboxypeptidase regulatory-like domain